MLQVACSSEVDTGSREKKTRKQEFRASVLIQSEPIMHQIDLGSRGHLSSGREGEGCARGRFSRAAGLMLFNDYPFLLGLPAGSHPDLSLRRSPSAIADLDAGAAVACLLQLRNPPFIALLVLSILINWLAARAYARTKHAVRSSRRRSSPISPCSALFKYANFLRYNLGLVLDRPMPHARYRAAARHLVLHLPSHHVSGRSAAGERRRPIRSTATRSTSRFSRRRSPGRWRAGRR